MEDTLDPDVARQLSELLGEQGVRWSDDFDLRKFEGVDPFEIEEEDPVSVWHWEVGWSWWSSVQRLLIETLGENRAPNALHLHAWNSVAVLAEVKPQIMGSPTPMGDYVEQVQRQRREGGVGEDELGIRTPWER